MMGYQAINLIPNSFNIRQLQLLVLAMIVDLTNNFRAELSKYPQQLISQSTAAKMSPNIKLYATYCDDIFNRITKIKKTLNDIRQNYFSNASYSYEAFTDRQRAQLNLSVRQTLTEVNNQINDLNEGLNKEQAFKRKTQKEHMKSIVMCLYQFYKQVEKIFRQFEEFSIKRRQKIEAQFKYYVASEKMKSTRPNVQKSINQFTDDELEKEAGLLYIEKVAKQKEIEQTKQQLQNINEMMTSMSNIVLQQQLKSSTFLQIGETGLFHIQKGNRNLIEANILARTTGRWWSYLFFSMGLILLILDFLKS